MQKIRIRLPATLTQFAPGLDSLGLAINRYLQVDVHPRSDDQLIVETSGEGAGHYPLGLRHPVVLGMMRVFQNLEQAPLGIHIRVSNQIALNSGLGGETAMWVAGVLAANQLCQTGATREEIIRQALQIAPQPAGAVSALLGGACAQIYDADTPMYRPLPLSPFKLILAVPQISDYAAPILPERVLSADAQHDLRRMPFVLEALRTGDLGLLAQICEDRLHSKAVFSRISGFQHVAEIARLAGALGVTSSSGGPALVFLASARHDRIAEAIESAFGNLSIPAEVFVVSLDTQGLILSLMQSA